MRTEMTAKDMMSLITKPVMDRVRSAWLARLEAHCMRCAEVEERKARDANNNVRYYHARAAMAKVERMDVELGRVLRK